MARYLFDDPCEQGRGRTEAERKCTKVVHLRQTHCHSKISVTLGVDRYMKVRVRDIQNNSPICGLNRRSYCPYRLHFEVRTVYIAVQLFHIEIGAEASVPFVDEKQVRIEPRG